MGNALGNDGAAMLMQAGGGSDITFFIPMAAVFLIFYFLVFRPQQKQQKERDDSIKAAVKGDRVVTAGGLHGTITGVGDDTFTIEVGRVKGTKVEVEVARAKVDGVMKSGQSDTEGGNS